jgi:hypothetical protein
MVPLREVPALEGKLGAELRHPAGVSKAFG